MKLYEIARANEKQHLIGAIHIRLPDLGLNIKGITQIKAAQQSVVAAHFVEPWIL